MITADQLEHLFPNIKDAEDWAEALNKHLPMHFIESKEEVASFLAQTGVESARYTTTVENLNYSVKGLLAVFPKYFNPALANQYARKPSLIANRVYANRLGNGPESSGDGWKFRGRGLIQVTGRNNYVECSRAIFGDDRLTETPEILEEVNEAVLSACWFWITHNLNYYATDVKRTTRIINGGYHGLDERIALYEAAMNTL